VYDNDAEDLLGQGFFILEVTVEQVVYVTSTMVLSMETIVDIVESGFNRGSGGRVKFRSLLRENDTFASVLNVEVLDGKLSSPQVAPSPPPSPFPTTIPSVMPSIYPSNLSSMAPSGVPSGGPSTRPSFQPASVASQSPSSTPSQSPSADPTIMRTPKPTAIPASSPPLSTPDQQPLILGAIAGGVATVLVSCFFIFCVWFPFCGRKPGQEDESSDDSTEQRRRRFGASYLSASPYNLATGSFVPGEVRLDDENQSLANTTLGDQTAGGAFGRPHHPKKKRHMDNGNISMLDSFDESSLYTSAFEINDDVQGPSRAMDMSATSLAPSAVTTATSTVLPPSLSRTLDFEEDLIFPVSESNTDSRSGGVSMSRSRTSTRSRPVDLDEGPVDIDTLEFIEDRESEDEESSDSENSAFADEQTVTSDERSEESSLSEQYATRRVFDPFEDGTSGSSSSVSSSIHSGKVRGPDSSDDSPSNSRADTVNIATGSGDEDVYQPAISSGPLKDPPAQSVVDRANNSLLRNILEDARLLAKQKSSSRSKISRKSAPSRLLSKSDNASVRHSETVSLVDLLADNSLLESSAPYSSRRSTKSVGGASRTSAMGLFAESKVSENQPNQMLEAQSDNPFRTRFLDRPAQVQPHHFIPASEDDTAKQELLTPVLLRVGILNGQEQASEQSNPATPASSEPGMLGAQPRDKSWETLNEESQMFDTPSSSPGVLGIMDPPTKKPIILDDASDASSGFSNPWLFDAIEQTLGPRSPAADMESISGRSTRSGKSHKSNHSTKSHKSSHSGSSRKSAASERSRASRDSYRSHQAASSRRTFRTKGRSKGRERTLAERNSSSVGSLVSGSRGEQKSSSGDMIDMIEPRTLENDVKRLERQLASVLQHETDQITASSISVSSAGASTLSSKHFAKRSKKKRVIVIVPPGKLGVVLANRHDGKGTVVSEVRHSSSLNGMLSPGDKLVAVDGEDVTGMVVSQITSLMSSSSQERRLTWITTAKSEPEYLDSQEEKVAESA